MKRQPKKEKTTYNSPQHKKFNRKKIESEREGD